MATAISHQTVRLSRGKHSSPEEGVCVMELASMLTGEQFTDRPTSVCPVIASFMRMYNDLIDDQRRQELYGYAAKAVGSRASVDVQRARAARVAENAVQLRRARRRWWSLPEAVVGFWCGPEVGLDMTLAVCEYTRRGPDGHRAALSLIDELLSITDRAPSTVPAPMGADASAPVTVAAG